MLNFFRRCQQPKQPKVRIEPTLTLDSLIEKSIVFIDGDQGIPDILNAYDTHVKGRFDECHIVRACTADSMPNKFKKLSKDGVNLISLAGMTNGKEVTDKFIAAYIQKAISEKFNSITVVSSDYDFIDIFKMSAKLSDTTKLKLRLIAPHAIGKLCNAKVTGVEIIKMKG